MPVSQKKFTVDDDEYEITQLGAKKGRKLWLKLAHVAAAPLKELGQSPKLNEAAMLAALAAAVENLDDDTAEALYEAFGESCTLRTPAGNWLPLTGVMFDQHFAGRYLSMTKWLWECVSYNFASFLGDTSVGSMGDLVRKVVASKQSSLTGLTGSSGES